MPECLCTSYMLECTFEVILFYSRYSTKFTDFAGQICYL